MSRYEIVDSSVTDWHPSSVAKNPFAVKHRQYGWDSYRLFPTVAAAEEFILELEFEDSQPAGRRKSTALEAARTVHSRAKTSLPSPVHTGGLTEEDLEIYADLRRVVEILDKWKRTGRMPKYKKEA